MALGQLKHTRAARWRWVVISILMAFLCLSQAPLVRAANNIIRGIDMSIYIDAYGTAHVTETWQASLERGTEGYKPYGNLGKSEIKDFKVTDDTGTVYQYVSTWDVEGSLENKKNKNTILKTKDGVELCWGISEYGDRTYTLEYKITGFVHQYKDYQGVYFSLMQSNMEQSVSRIRIAITSDHAFSVSNARIWGFGYSDGIIVFEDGAIVMDTNGQYYSSNDYMVVLIKFERDFFQTDNRINKTFESVQKKAMVGADPGYREPGWFEENRETVFAFGITFGIIIIAVQLQKRRYRAERSEWSERGEVAESLPPLRQAEYWRDIPCGGDVLRAGYLVRRFDLFSEGSSGSKESALIGAFLLKWLGQREIEIIQLPKKLFSTRDNNYAVDLRRASGMENEVEEGLLHLLRRAAGVNGMLEPKEFGKWCKKNFRAVTSWFSSVSAFESMRLQSSGMITDAVHGYSPVTQASSELRKEALRLQGLKRFLLDFSTIAQREVFEVSLWEGYLIFAQLLGIADKVREQFSKVYPQFDQISALGTGVTSGFVRSMSDNCHRGVRSGRDRAERAGRSTSRGGGSSGGRSSGRGGRSSGRGGGGSSGRSSGGGFR